MKKLLIKDLTKRKRVEQFELEYFMLRQVSSNSNFLKTLRWNAFFKLANSSKQNSKTILSNRCIKTSNKKSFHKLVKFSRIVFLKLARFGYFSGIRKSSW